MVLVAGATVPGLRRLESALSLLPLSVAWLLSSGAPAKRWPKRVSGSPGPRTRQLIESGLFVSVPVVDDFQSVGITSESLPQPLLLAAEDLLRLVDQLIPIPVEKDG